MNAGGHEGRNEGLARLRGRINNQTDGLLTGERKAKMPDLEGEPFTGDLLSEGSVK
jgi:hypothetical protein